jgi:flagellar FliL protein
LPIKNSAKIGKEPKTLKKIILISTAITILLAGAGGGYYFFVYAADDDNKTSEVEIDTREYHYVEIPPVVANFQVGKKMRYVQVTTSVQTRDENSKKTVEKNLPLIQSELLLLMQQSDFDSISSVDGKALLLKDIEGKILAMFGDMPSFEIERAMMTGFVIQ